MFLECLFSVFVRCGCIYHFVMEQKLTTSITPWITRSWMQRDGCTRDHLFFDSYIAEAVQLSLDCANKRYYCNQLCAQTETLTEVGICDLLLQQRIIRVCSVD
jgi:hypothetical protein